MKPVLLHPRLALENTTANQAAVDAIITTSLLNGYLTTDNLSAVTNHLGTRGSFAARPSAGYDTVWKSIESLSASDSGHQSLLALALTELGVLKMQPRFFQCTNMWDNKVNNEPQGDLHALDANNVAITPKLTVMGEARYASNWTLYRKWKPANDVGTINSDTTAFATDTDSSLGTTTDVSGVKCKLAGYYRATCHMHFYFNQFRAAIAVRFAINALDNDDEDGNSETPGPIQITGSINSGGSKRNAQTVSLSHVFNL